MKKNNNSGKMKEDIKLFLGKRRVTVKDAMKKMDEADEKILFMVDDDERLLGSLTDGDIRRWILKEGALLESVDKAFNLHPVFVNEDYNIGHVKKVMVNQRIKYIPVVNKRHKIVDLLVWEDIFKSKQKNKNNLEAPVVMMAGGTGLRLDPFTKILPKPLIPIGDKAVSEIIMERFNECGCKDFYLMLGHKAEMVKTYFHNIGDKYKITYIQENEPLGTSGALHLLPEDFSEDFFVTNCDTIIKADYRDMYKFHLDNEYDMTLISSMQHLTVPYGVIEIDNHGYLRKISEKPEYDFLANTGMYVFKKSILTLIPKGKIFHITDLINIAKKEGRRVGVYPISRKSWLDVGQWEEYRRTLREFDAWVKG